MARDAFARRPGGQELGALRRYPGNRTSEEATRLQIDFNLATGSRLCPASAQGQRFSRGEMIGVYDTDTDVFVAEVVETRDGELVLRIHFDQALTDT